MLRTRYNIRFIVNFETGKERKKQKNDEKLPLDGFFKNYNGNLLNRKVKVYTWIIVCFLTVEIIIWKV